MSTQNIHFHDKIKVPLNILNVCFLVQYVSDEFPRYSIKVLTALVGKLSPGVGKENDPERELKTVSLNL